MKHVIPAQAGIADDGAAAIQLPPTTPACAGVTSTNVHGPGPVRPG
jgi:hypothetical protein